MTQPTAEDKMLRAFIIVVVVILMVFAGFIYWATRPAKAHDAHHPDAVDPVVREWYQSLMQPDAPTASCCGEADAYWCDSYRFEGGKALCTISDDRPDAPRRRPHVPVGTVIEIPSSKLKWDRSNPTGHGVVFMSRSYYVFCYVQPEMT